MRGLTTAQLNLLGATQLDALNINDLAMTGESMSTVVSLSGGALVANLISVILLISETLRQTR